MKVNWLGMIEHYGLDEAIKLYIHLKGKIDKETLITVFECSNEQAKGIIRKLYFQN